MSVSSIIKALVLVLLLCSVHQSFSQEQNTWGFEISPGISNSSLASGTAVMYPDSPYYVNLKIRTPYRFSYRIEATSTRTSKRNWYLSKGLGISSYSYVLHFDYDRQASVANIISDRNDFMFVHGVLRIGKSYQIGQIAISGYGGLTVNYMVKAKQTVDTRTTKAHYNNLGKFERWAFGWEAGISGLYPLTEKTSVQIRPSVNKILKTYSADSRRVYSFGLGFGVLVDI